MEPRSDLLRVSVTELQTTKGLLQFLEDCSEELKKVFESLDANKNIYFVAATCKIISEKFKTIEDNLNHNHSFKWIENSNLIDVIEKYNSFYELLNINKIYDSILVLKLTIDSIKDSIIKINIY